jgi:hypothetical protein
MTDAMSRSELSMWDVAPAPIGTRANDDEINAKYASREWRIVTESNREQLPNFVEALKRPGWMDVRPHYQRRRRWDAARQSKLIESFIMNIPVPPLFVYEADLAKYEVMDGQQRITAIRDFYSNELRLKGLEQWPELNGRNYSKLPSEIRKGIDRRSIAYTVLLKESAETSEEQALLRQLVFERLNTGGIELSQQEVRNALYQGPFNSMLLELARHPLFRQAWGLPPATEDEDNNPSPSLQSNTFFSQMRDVEVVLRFFALRHGPQYQRGMQGFLDLYMLRSRRFDENDLSHLRGVFDQTIGLATRLYDDVIFRPWDPETQSWSPRPQVAFSDAVMVGLSRSLDLADTLSGRRDDVLRGTRVLFETHEPGTFTGRGNTKADVNERIDLYAEMLRAVATN